MCKVDHQYVRHCAFKGAIVQVFACCLRLCDFPGREEPGMGGCSATGTSAGSTQCHGSTARQRAVQVACHQSKHPSSSKHIEHLMPFPYFDSVDLAYALRL